MAPPEPKKKAKRGRNAFQDRAGNGRWAVYGLNSIEIDGNRLSMGVWMGKSRVAMQNHGKSSCLMGELTISGYVQKLF